MYVAEVHFNHDPASANHDALNIRRNGEGDSIRAPEWRFAYTPEPAAYACAAVSDPVTILVRVRDGPRGGAAWIRAVDALLPPVSRPGCANLIANAIVKAIHLLFGNVLGDVSARLVAFDASGDSGLVPFHLLNHKLTTAPVGARMTQWLWQQRPGSSNPFSGWQDFDHTSHRIYTLLDVPRAPWSQAASENNTQLPWTDALEKACAWAIGATDIETAAAKITRALNTRGNQGYQAGTAFTTSTTYRLSSHIHELDHSDTFLVNCSDCAAAVSTFANVLGCDLVAGKFLDMDTRPIMMLGSPDPSAHYLWGQTHFVFHEIAWVSPIGATQPVHDACLSLDLDWNDGDFVHIPELATGKIFSGAGPTDYRTLLIASGSGGIEGVPRRRRVV